jgi:hypothetical protein
MTTSMWTTALVTILLAAGTGCDTTDDTDEDGVAEARADLDALYKGDYRSAFVEKQPELFLRHIHDDFTAIQIDGSTATAEQMRQFFPALIGSIEQVIDHNVTIENVEVDDDGQIDAVVTLTTVMHRRSQAGVVYAEISVGTYRDTFVREDDGTLMETRGAQLRSVVTGAAIP